jgi:hypothetical protein
MIGIGTMEFTPMDSTEANEERKNIIKETKNLFTKIFSSKETN